MEAIKETKQVIYHSMFALAVGVQEEVLSGWYVSIQEPPVNLGFNYLLTFTNVKEDTTPPEIPEDKPKLTPAERMAVARAGRGQDKK
jgi:hypothetical protein